MHFLRVKKITIIQNFLKKIIVKKKIKLICFFIFLEKITTKIPNFDDLNRALYRELILKV